MYVLNRDLQNFTLQQSAPRHPHLLTLDTVYFTNTMALCNPAQVTRGGGGAGKARFNVATPTYEARTRPLHVQHTYYRIIFEQNPFNIISRGVQRRTSTDFRLK